MATWQFVIELIPKIWWDINHDNSNLFSNDEMFDVEVCWVNNQPTVDVIKEFDNLLPRTESWSKNLIIWGDIDATDITVGFQDEMIDGISIRFDLRGAVLEVIKKIIAFSEANDYLFYLPIAKKVIAPQMLIEEINSSDAMRFVQNPRDFLDSIKSTNSQ